MQKSANTITRPRSISDPMTYAEGIPHEEFARRRRECPVGWVEETPLWRQGGATGMPVTGSGYWAVTRYEDVITVSKNPHVFSSGYRGAFLADPKTHQDLQRTQALLINMDDPEHARLRRIASSAFTPRMVRLLAGRIHLHAEELVATLAERGQFDAVTHLTAELPLLSLADLLGIPPADRQLLFTWSNNLVGFDDPSVAAGNIELYKRTFSEAFAYALELANGKLRKPADDLVSHLTSAMTKGEITEHEYLHLFILLVVAGNETTRHLLSGSLYALATNTEERDRLVARPKLTALAVEELLRFVSPVIQFRRTAIQETYLAGQRIRADDKVVLYYASANRDERVFDSPHRLDLGRNPNPHLAFGTGPHFCLGAHLARLEATILLDALRPHLSRFKLVEPETRLASNFVNGIKSMPACFDKEGRHV